MAKESGECPQCCLVACFFPLTVVLLLSQLPDHTLQLLPGLLFLFQTLFHPFILLDSRAKVTCNNDSCRQRYHKAEIYIKTVPFLIHGPHLLKHKLHQQDFWEKNKSCLKNLSTNTLSQTLN